MRQHLPLLLIASLGLAFTACETTTSEEENSDRYGYGATGENSPRPTPTPTPKPKVKTTEEENVPSTPSVEVDPMPTPVPVPVMQDYPTAAPVDGKPGFVKSPFGGAGIVDVRGYPPGTEVKDPYTGKVFLVP